MIADAMLLALPYGDLCDRQVQQSATKSNFGDVGHRTYNAITGRNDCEPSALMPLPGAEALCKLAPALMAGVFFVLGGSMGLGGGMRCDG
jgi:hypothetical protein